MEDEEDYAVFITESGAALARVAIRLYARGFSADDIYDILGLPEIDDLDMTKEEGLALFMLVARETGAFD